MAPVNFCCCGGPNGVGKSTLLRTLYRSYLPRAGHIWYHTTEGRIDLAVAADVDIALLRRREIGFVTQFLIARPRVAAEDIVAEPLRRAGIPAAQAVDEARRWLAEFGVKCDLWRAYPTTMILAFPASRNLSPHPALQWVTARYLEICRTVPDLVWALIFVCCFSVGPLAGVVAIATHATGSLGKLYSEAIENIDMRPLDGVKSAGGSWFDQCRYGALPQVLPNVLSYTLLRFEINVRSSSIIGYVGAGGLGQEFRIAMSFQEYTDLSALFLITLATVMIIDCASEKLRHRVIGAEQT